jgi:tyrosine-protein kinase Etk/Wzc
MENQKVIDYLTITRGLLLILKQNYQKIIIITVIPSIIATIYVFLLPPIFTAKVLINPPKLSDAGSGISGSIGTVSMFDGWGYQKSDIDIAISMLQTNALSKIMRRKFDPNEAKNNDARLIKDVLDRGITFFPDPKTGFLGVAVDGKNPKFVAEIANYYVVALGQLINDIAWRRANSKAEFFAEQMIDTKKSLNEIELKLKQFMQKNSILAGQQVQVIAGIASQLQLQLVTAQMQLQSMGIYASPNNPEYKALSEKIQSIKDQLSKLNNQNTDDKVIIPAGIAPDLAEEYVILSRELKLREQIYSVVTRQYEATKLDALSEIKPLSIQIIDPAVIPSERSKPNRLKIISGVLLVSLLVSVVFFIIRNHRLIVIKHKVR